MPPKLVGENARTVREIITRSLYEAHTGDWVEIQQGPDSVGTATPALLVFCLAARSATTAR